MTGKYHYHIRSTSLPSTSHPLTAMVEQQLNNLREWETSSHTTTSTTTAEMLLEGFSCGLKGLYESVEDLLRLPNTQHVLVNHRNEKWVNETLEGSLIRLLDVSGTTRDVLFQMKQNVQEIRSVLRRKRGSGETDLGSDISLYMASRKKSNKEIRKCLGELIKGIEKRKVFSSLLEKQNHFDQDLVAVLSVLRKVEAVTVSLCESLLVFMSAGTSTRSINMQKPRGWSLVSKLMHKHNKGGALVVEEMEMNEVKKVDATLNNLVTSRDRKTSSLCDETQVGIAHKGLETLEASIDGLEEGLEWVFRQLIKTRVSLLNILNN